MESGTSWQLFLLVILIGLSSFFSATETALMSLSKIRIRHLVEEKVKNADKVAKLIENPSKLLGSILVGNNIVNIGASALANSLAINYFGNAGVGIATGMMTIIVLIFGEITPKSLAVQHSETISLRIAGLVTMITYLFSPVVTVLLFITNGFIKILGGKPAKSQPFITEEEIRTMVDVSHEEGVLECDEKQMIHNVFEFTDALVRNVMIPRPDMVAVELSTPYEKILETFREEQFSRIPVYEETIDNIVGVIYFKDIFFKPPQNNHFVINEYLREPHYTFEYKKIPELFQELRVKHQSIAIVLDEYGGTAGIVTMEDLVEEIVGEIQDEYDEPATNIQVIKEDEYIVDGSTKIHELNDMIGVNVESEDFDSIGGFIVGIFGYIPEPGETVEYQGIQFKIEEVDRNRISKVRVFT